MCQYCTGPSSFTHTLDSISHHPSWFSPALTQSHTSTTSTRLSTTLIPAQKRRQKRKKGPSSKHPARIFNSVVSTLSSSVVLAWPSPVSAPAPEHAPESVPASEPTPEFAQELSQEPIRESVPELSREAALEYTPDVSQEPAQAPELRQEKAAILRSSSL